MKMLRPLLFIVVSLLAPLASARTEFPQAAQPQLYAASDGRVWLAFGRPAEAPPAPASPPASGHHGHGPAARGAGEIYVASSRDGGATFSSPVKVATVPQLMLGLRRGPRITADGDRITVTAIGQELLAFSSADGGKTWSSAVVINDVPNSAREGLHDLAGTAGERFVTWLDLRNSKMELWAASSADGGLTWSRNQAVYISPEKTICECCHPTALFDAAGNLAVMWRNALQGSRDMWLATRPARSTRFGPAEKLGTGTWTLNACPMDGGRLFALGSGKFGSVFQRAGDVFAMLDTGAETRLGKGKQPVAAMTPSGPMIVWQDGAALVGTRSLTGLPVTTLAKDGRFPSLVTVSDGKTLLLAYEHGTKQSPGVVVERL